MLSRILLSAIASLVASPCIAMVFVVGDLAQERDIRSELLFAGTRGPIPTIIRAEPGPGTATAVIETLGHWSDGGGIKFAAAARDAALPDGYFVVFVFNQPRRIQGSNLCSGSYAAQSPQAGASLNVSAAFCLRDFPLTSAYGSTGAAENQDSAMRQLVSAVASVLFPRTGLPSAGNSTM